MRLRHNKTLITGKPAVGKTTLVQTIVARMASVNMAGFYTAEIRSKGPRLGFELHGLDGTRRILPMQKRAAGKPVILEICPASTLKAAGLYGTYKGRSEAHRMARQSILDRLPGSRPFRIANEQVREKAIENAGGDALDSIIAAMAAFHVLNGNFVSRGGDRNLYAIEGYVFI